MRPSGTYASDGTEQEWALIAPLLPAAKRRATALDLPPRRVVNAVFYLLQTGCQWRMLPRDSPPRGVVSRIFRTFSQATGWAEEGPYAIELVRRLPFMTGFVVLRRRWVVERAFAWIIKCRRLVRDYEHLAGVAETLITIAASATPIRRRP